MTTLYKAIEAAREALKEAPCTCSWEHGGQHSWIDEVCQRCKALSTLPAEPMTEEEIMYLISDPSVPDNKKEVLHIIRALRDAGVLYVKEEK